VADRAWLSFGVDYGDDDSFSVMVMKHEACGRMTVEPQLVIDAAGEPEALFCQGCQRYVGIVDVRRGFGGNPLAPLSKS
jgi:hypothetical protein